MEKEAISTAFSESAHADPVGRHSLRFIDDSGRVVRSVRMRRVRRESGGFWYKAKIPQDERLAGCRFRIDRTGLG